MRETRKLQASLFDNYAKHEFGIQLKALSELLDEHTEILPLIEKDLVGPLVKKVGRCGLSVESVFRCLLLKQQLQVSYEQLSFHLSDSMSYRTFTRLPEGLSPSSSGLQSTIRSIRPETLEKVYEVLSIKWIEEGKMSLEKSRIDSTVVKSHITPPSDSQLLNDSVRVLSRFFAKSQSETGVKIRFTDKRKASKSLAFAIFNAKNAIKETLYPEMLILARVVLRQADRALKKVKAEGESTLKTQKWIGGVEHFRSLLSQVIDQTQSRVIDKKSVPASEKIVSIFEEHTDIIVKGFRDVQYGHKVNLSTEDNGFITCFSIEKGNPADKDLFLPVLDAHTKNYKRLPTSTVCDGGYASKKNASDGRSLGLKHAVFHKRVGISYQDMGVKIKTFKKLRNFRAGVEGNISELKRAFGAGKAKWKGHDGFKAFVWSSVLCYNLVRMARQPPG
jgi:IS5 family transposase